MLSIKMTTTDWTMTALLVMSAAFAYLVVKTLDMPNGLGRIVYCALAACCAIAAGTLIQNLAVVSC